MSRILDWLFDRGASCADLREECSLLERQAECLHEAFMEERGEKWSAREAAEENAAAAQVQAQMCEEARGERDAALRELWMERRRNAEMREDSGPRYEALANLWRIAQEASWGTSVRLAEAQQRRKDAEAERDRARRQCEESGEALANALFQVEEWRREAALRGERIAELETLTKKGATP